MRRFFIKPVILLISFFVFSAAILSQDLDDVTISGRVTDSNNQNVAGATVTAKLIATGAERTASTDDEGRYRFIDLPPGVYTVKASASGFGAKERKDIETLSGQNIQLNFQLAPGDVKAETTVTVTDEDGPLVDTTRTIVGGTLTGREIEEIPNNTRNALDLVLTLGGTSEQALSTRDLAEDRNSNNTPPPTEQGNFSLSGGASYSNNLTIDGLDNNDDRAANSRFQPSLESIAEVQVIRNQFSAEYGRASGGRINLRTRSGTNNFRGRAFMFFRDEDLNANTWNNNRTLYTINNNASGTDTFNTISRPPLERNPFTNYTPGFIFSGPVIIPFGEGKSFYNGKNKTFFSIAYEHDLLQDTTLIETYVPSGGQNPRFSLPSPTSSSQFCESQTTVSGVSTCNLAIPRATFISPYSASIASPNKNHSFTARLDHKLYSKNDMTIGWQLGRRRNERQNVASTTRLLEALQGSTADTDAVNFTDNHVFGANAVNQFRFQWSKYLPGYTTKNTDNPVVLIGYTNPLTLSGNTLIAGNSSAANAARGLFPDRRKEVRYQFQDSLTYVAGNHTLKFGGDFQRVNSLTTDTEDTTGTYNFGNGTYPIPGATAPGPTTYSAIQNFLLNQVTRFRQNFGTSSEVKNTYWGIFGNDELKVMPNLTLSYGLRYERETVLDDKNNFGPRFGIAWDPFKKGKGVIRFGAGIFYNRVLLRTIDDFIINGQQVLFDSNNITTTGNLRLNVLRALSNNFPRGYASPQEIGNILVANGATATTGFTGSNTAFQRLIDPTGLKIPESYQFNVGFEREINKLFVFEANYTWNKTAHLWREYNPNAPRTPAGFTDLNDFLVKCSLPIPVGDCSKFPTSGAFRFENGLSTAADTRVAGALTFVNLNSQNPSEASSSPIGLALAAVDGLRANPNIDQQELIASIGNAFYQGFVFELRSRYRKLGAGFGANFRSAYTLSYTKDDGLNNTSDAEVNGDFSREWARSLQDRRHRLAFSGTFDTPWWMGKLRFSPLVRYGSSAPFNLSYGGIDRNLDDLSNDRINFSGDVKDIIWRKPGSAAPSALISQFSLQPIGSKGGNLPRNAGTGPSFYVFDLSITREWKFTEKMRLRPSVEFGNILNSVVFSYGSGFIDFSSFSAAATLAQRRTFERDFLVPNRAFRPRDIRLGIRFDF